MEIHPLLINYAVTTHGKPHLLIFEREDNTWYIGDNTVVKTYGNLSHPY